MASTVATLRLVNQTSRAWNYTYEKTLDAHGNSHNPTHENIYEKSPSSQTILPGGTIELQQLSVPDYGNFGAIVSESMINLAL